MNSEMLTRMRAVTEAVNSGRISRRQWITWMLAAGVSGPAILGAGG